MAFPARLELPSNQKEVGCTIRAKTGPSGPQDCVTQCNRLQDSCSSSGSLACPEGLRAGCHGERQHLCSLCSARCRRATAQAVSGFPLEIARAPCPPTSLSWIPYQPNILKASRPCLFWFGVCVERICSQIPGASWAPPALPLSVCEGLPGRTLALAHGPASAPASIQLPEA
eukprot:g15931.t1